MVMVTAFVGWAVGTEVLVMVKDGVADTVEEKVS